MYYVLYIVILLVLLLFISNDKKLIDQLEKYKLFIIILIIYLGYQNNNKYHIILLFLIVFLILNSNKIQNSEIKENISNYLKNGYLNLKESVNQNYKESFTENRLTNEEYEEEKNIIIEENSNKYDQLKEKFNNLENKIKSML